MNGGYLMNREEYQKIVDEFTPKPKKLKNAIVAFLVGGLVGFIGELVALILQNTFSFSVSDSYIWVCILMIFTSSFLTALGFFDTWVTKCKAGLFLPTTGFAHSVTSAALDYRQDGLITGLGSNFFKLAGSVILYGILSGFFFGILGVIFYG